MLVDAVSRVTKIGDGEIELPQETTTGCGREYIAGLAKKDEKIIILLDPAVVLANVREETAEKAAV